MKFLKVKRERSNLKSAASDRSFLRLRLQFWGLSWFWIFTVWATWWVSRDLKDWLWV